MAESSISRRGVLRTAATVAAAVPFAGAITGAAPAQAGGVPSAVQPPTPTAEPVDLHWLEGVPAHSPGTTFGVPWPRGAYQPSTSFAARTSDGSQVPLQSWPLAYWPDGSLKWTGHAIPAGEGLVERLTLTEGTPARGRGRIVARATGGYIEVINGAIRCRIMRTGFNVLHSLRLDGEDKAHTGRLVLITEDTVDPAAARVNRTEYQGWVEDAEIEQSGRLRTVVKVTGSYRKGNRYRLPFTVRLYFYAGADSVRIVHSFIFNGDKDSDFIKGIGLRWSVPMRDELHDRHIRFVGEEDGVWGEAVRVISGLRRDPGPAARNAQFDGEATPPPSQWGGGQNWPVQMQDIPIWNDFKLVQSSADSFQVAKRTGDHSSWLLHAGYGRRAYGLGWLGGPTGGGVAFGLRDFWEKHPTQLEIGGAGTDEATVTVWLWSPDVPAMDLRHYDNIRHNLNIMYEEPGRGLDDLVATPEGIARSHEVMIWALPATPTRQRLLELTEVLRSPPLLVADPEYYHSQQPFGVWSLPDRSTPTRQALENDIDRRIEFYQQQIEQRRWYGFWFHGDVMWGYDTTRHTWRYDSGGHAWHQGELANDQALWYQFLRTGRPDVFRMAEAMTLNIAETAVHHIGFFAGLGSRHNVIKWGDGAKEVRISASQVKRFYYYLTADERTGDYLKATLQADQTMLDVPPLREALPDPSGERYIVRIGPDWIGLASNWLTEWERTGDTQWRDRIAIGLQNIADMEIGMFTGNGGSVAFDPATGELEDVGINQSPSNISLLFGGDQVFYQLVDLVDVPDFTEEFLNFCIARTGTAQERIALYGRDLNQGGFQNDYARMMAFAGVRLGNDSYKQRAWDTFNPNARRFPNVQSISGPTTLTTVEHAGNVFTNDSGQVPMGIIQLLQLAPDQAP